MNVNLACGSVYVNDGTWLNFDYVSNSSKVKRANLLAQLPLNDSEVDLVYSSHFLEHIPRDQVVPFLSECFRILKPGGLLRIVVPDLENLCRTYLHYRDQADHEKADFLIIELLDQCLRRQSGGELGRFYRSLTPFSPSTEKQIAFVRERLGEDLARPPLTRQSNLSYIIRRIPELAERLWIRGVIQLLPRAFRQQNVSFACVGECHHWVYDFYSLQKLLFTNGFVSIVRLSASSSRCSDFPFFPLDLLSDGHPRKGFESMYIEAQKPG